MDNGKHNKPKCFGVSSECDGICNEIGCVWLEECIAAIKEEHEHEHEHIQCAAIKARYHVNSSTCVPVIFQGEMHCSCLAMMHSLGITHIGRVDGFMTTNDRFVDRQEAYVIAESQGQIIEKYGSPKVPELYSEDIGTPSPKSLR